MAKEDNFDIAVIGAGPAGMMAAGEAVRLGLRVILVEKNNMPGKKLLLTGNGRCNLTNAEFDLRELVKNYNNGEFLFHAFFVFGPKKVISFFEKLGVKTKIEKNKKVFPVSDDADDVLDALIKYLADSRVKIVFGSEVIDIDCNGKKINKIILKGSGTSSGAYTEVRAKKYILCTGGKSYPSTGSNGFGYKLAEKMGHTVVGPKPALSPIKIKDDPSGSRVKNLQGISLKDIKISVVQNGKKQIQEEGEILFTHFGISGPAILNISGKIGDLLGKGEIKMHIDLFPLLNQEVLMSGLEDILKKHAGKTIKNILSIFVPERFGEIMLDVSGIDKNKIANNMSKLERAMIVRNLKNFEITAEDVFGFDQALVTRGGLSVKEIDNKTMRSKIINNLFFAGEIIDIDGKTGGFNLQACWSTGYLAGKSAAA